jgi:hypothetical protein
LVVTQEVLRGQPDVSKHCAVARRDPEAEPVQIKVCEENDLTKIAVWREAAVRAGDTARFDGEEMERKNASGLVPGGITAHSSDCASRK